MRKGFSLLVGLTLGVQGQEYLGNLPAEHPAIRYAEAVSQDPAARLDRQLEGGIGLDYDARFGYLPALLRQLHIPVDSQLLVFSRTSFQAAKISPSNPRAIYFNDDVAVGWVPGAERIEIAAQDPALGTVFYTLRVAETARPRLVREQSCLQCHQGPATLGVPGIFVGSVFPNQRGLPHREGAIITDYRTPFADRWGGWYVTARQGQQVDRSNTFAWNPAEPEILDTTGKQNLVRLPAAVQPERYLAPTSDIVALLTFEHQTRLTNLLTRLHWETRLAGKEPERVNRTIRDLVEGLFSVGEVPIPEQIQGVSLFAERFSRGGAFRRLDLQTRLFRLPLSYMVESRSFRDLPLPVHQAVMKAIHRVLDGQDPAIHVSLSPAQRGEIQRILERIDVRSTDSSGSQ